MFPSIVSRLRRSYHETGECSRRQGQDDSRMTTPRQDVFHVVLPRRMNTARALEIHFQRATEVHLSDQNVRYKLHYGGMRARRSARGPFLTAY